MKKVLTWSLVLTLIIACFPPLSVQAADDPSTYQIYYTYSDIQAEKGSADLRYGTNTNHIAWQLLSTNDASRKVNANGIFYLARNEREGIQIFYYGTAEATRKKLSVTVSEFTNDDGVKLAHSVFKEGYVTPLGLTFRNNVLRLADPLIPYDGASVDLTAGENEMFYIEVRSETDQPAGVYYANVTFADEDGVFRTNRIAAVVWDFALPQQHHASMILGLHNAASGYGTTSGFLRQNGVNFDQNGNILEEDKEKAYRIIAGWNEYLLDHGISPYEITYNLVDDNPKAAQLAMADIRQKSFFIPLLRINSYNGSYGSATLERINQYKQVIGSNQSLLSKAVFYVRDEVYLNTEEAKNILVDQLTAAGNAWPQVKRMVTYNNSDGTPQNVLDLMDTTKDIICINTETFLSNTVIHDAYMNTFAYKWRYYPGDNWHGTFELWLYGKSSVGQFRRKVFWDQHYNRENMLLYWNGAYYHNNFNVWETMELPRSQGMQTGNGNGVLLYPGLAIGQDPETPIGSLRIKQIASGIDDADYLALADEFLPAEEVPAWTSFFPEWEVTSMNGARIALGNKLEQAAKDSPFTHNFGEWECLVEADSTHRGLETRTCTACGTVESRETEANTTSSWTMELNAGWNWVGFPLLPNNKTIANVLGTNGFTFNDLVEVSNDSARFNGAAWLPSDSEIGYNKLYKIYVSEPVKVEFTGNAGPTSFAVSPGWNWIANPCLRTVQPSELTHSAGFTAGDRIQGPLTFVTYSGSSWIPTQSMPLGSGKGFLLYTAKGGVLSFPENLETEK